MEMRTSNEKLIMEFMYQLRNVPPIINRDSEILKIARKLGDRNLLRLSFAIYQTLYGEQVPIHTILWLYL
jgi:hypothetical protein